MEKSHTIILIGALLFVALACSNGDKNEYVNSEGQLVVEELYSESQPKSRIIYMDESKSDFIYVTYYEDGSVMDSARYVDDIIEGKRKYYDKSSDLTHIEHYQEGFLHGINKAVYSNGTTSYEGYRYKGNKAGEWIFHYPAGGLITYEFYDTTGRLMYFRKYDENGNIIKTNGNPFIQIGDSVGLDSLNSGIIKLILACPPESKTELSAEIASSGEKLRLGTKEVTSPACQFPVKDVTPGRREVEFFVSIKNLKTGETEQSSRTKYITFLAK